MFTLYTTQVSSIRYHQVDKTNYIIQWTCILADIATGKFTEGSGYSKIRERRKEKGFFSLIFLSSNIYLLVTPCNLSSKLFTISVSNYHIFLCHFSQRTTLIFPSFNVIWCSSFFSLIHFEISLSFRSLFFNLFWCSFSFSPTHFEISIYFPPQCCLFSNRKPISNKMHFFPLLDFLLLN